MPRFALLALLLLPVAATAAPLVEPFTPFQQTAFARSKRLVGFLTALDWSKLTPADGIADNGGLVLAEKNKRYAVYAPAGGRVNLKIPAGNWRVREYNPRTGEWGKKRDETADDSGLTLKFAADEDWAAVLERD